MDRNVRLAIAGFGLVGRRHGDAIATTSGVDLVAVIEPGEAGQKAAADQGLPCFNNIEEFFARSHADGMILATPNSLHVPQAMTCIDYGCPVLVEKPIATTSDDARVLVQHANKKTVPLLVGHHRRHNPLIERAKKTIETGDLGQIRAVQATCWFYKPDHYFETAEWRKKNGAGPIAVNLVHDIDLIRYLCGEIRTVRAVASPSARGFENEDVASALLELENGAIGTVSVSDGIVAPWSWELTSREYPIYPPTSESSYLIGGSRGSLSIPDLRLWHYPGRDPDWWSPLSATALTRDATDPLVNQIKNFADVIAHGAQPLVAGEEGLKSLQVIEAIQYSAENDKTVALKSDQVSVELAS
ncbi:4-carboxy-2-hydroxymuconate-6-semialdehyde dehydrogenase [Labrenzia sp. THAF82]|uniref:Gfo/Idh/MocA family protein n=1 Tax=Labrenzia sp. THAF82 TaxID=2587861 RepID=UPI0012691D92|nr:Gfo/Idh/MocA family oxidoreductase [Labrenzia sp. THAF82]QFT29389.1 4-carboxy-2-hydroxymuconate-6-semialdehyde dehydrogenase [Labrenzia sp. THAF82]